MFALTSKRLYTQIPLIILLGALVFGAIGPFGQNTRFALFERIGLWIAYFLLAMPILIFANHIFAQWWQRTGWPHKLLALFAISCGAAWPILLIVELLGYAQGRPFPPDLRTVLLAWLEVVICVFPVLGIMDALQTPAFGGQGYEDCEERTSLDLVLGQDLAQCFHAFKAEGHYTLVFGPNGSQLIDLSFAQMLKLVSELDGAQVHRSWWIRRTAVIETRKCGSAYEATLPNRISAPIARRRVKTLRKQRWPV